MSRGNLWVNWQQQMQAAAASEEQWQLHLTAASA
jgi:hypothetical protein